MSDGITWLPSREESAASGPEEWIRALEVARQNSVFDLNTAGTLAHLRHLIASGRLVDSEAIDREAAVNAAIRAAHEADGLMPGEQTLRALHVGVPAAIAAALEVDHE